MVNKLDGTISSMVNRTENAFNTAGKIHGIGVVSGALRASVFTLKAVADVVALVALGIFSLIPNIGEISEFKDARPLKARLIGEVEQFKQKQIQNFKNIGLGLLEIIPFWGVTESRLSTTPNARKPVDEAIMNKNEAMRRGLAGDFYSPQEVKRQPPIELAGDM